MTTSPSQGYSLSNYGDMIADLSRRNGYFSALRQVIRPGSVVLDIGAGTGIFALMACRLGASRVYAIEPADAILVARELAVHNGFADRIVFIQDVSTRVSLPERVDVVVADLRGALPLFQHHLPVLADVRQRFLASDGVLVPHRDELYASVVEAPELYRSLTAIWAEGCEGIDLRPVGRFATNTPAKVYLRPEQLLARPLLWDTLDYRSRIDADVAGELTWTIERAGTVHGLAVWFDAYLVADISFSNAPSAPRALYGQSFFPLTAPVPVEVGDTVTASLEARLVGDDYVWRWNTVVRDASNPARVKARYRQSSFLGYPLSPRSLRNRAIDHVPVLDQEGRIDQRILSLMDGRRSLEEIAQELSRDFSGPFPTWQDALPRVGALSVQYTRRGEN